MVIQRITAASPAIFCAISAITVKVVTTVNLSAEKANEFEKHKVISSENRIKNFIRFSVLAVD